MAKHSAAKVAPKIAEGVSIKDITGESMSFANLLDESFKGVKSFEGSVVEGTVVAVDDEFVTLDDAQVMVHLLPKTLFQGLGKDDEPVTPQSGAAKFQATADFPWAQVWIYSWKNPREVLESVSFAHAK